MDPVSLQLAPMLPETFYDPSGLSSSSGYAPGYTNTPALWHGPGEQRGFQPHSSEFESHVRHNGHGGFSRRLNTTENNSEIETIENGEWADEEDTKEDLKPSPEHNSQKQSQVAATLKWLSENYERAEGVCLPRCVLYTHYLDFCKKNKFTPAGAATFGKIIRQRFPKLTTRRLGTRGQSKYHYYGIGIKESSIYYHSVYSGKGLTRFSGIKIKTEGSNRKYSLSSKTGTLLPEFPDAENLILPSNVEKDKMQTFIMMYRTHCQRILDTVISANFEEVQNFLLHFWQGMPEHLVDLLKTDVVTDVVGLCDSILYKVLIDVLIPSSIQDLPESLSTEIKLFVKHLPHWIENSMEAVEPTLKNRKLEVSKTFIQSIRRQMSFVHLAQTARMVLLNHDCVGQMIEDLSDLNFPEICCQTGFLEPATATKHGDTINQYFDEFLSLLNKQAPIEAYTEWMDNIIDTCVLQPFQTSSSKTRFKDKAAEFLLRWAAFGAFLMRDLTLHNASSFGSFHLIHIMFDEYAFLVMETQQEQDIEKDLQRKVQRHMKNAEEIKTQAKVRNSGKSQISPKCKKRKHEDLHESNDEGEENSVRDENHSSSTIAQYTPLNGTAFSRPVPSNRENAFGMNGGDDVVRQNNPHGNLPLSPLKPYQTLNGTTYDRPTYIPQFGLNSYSDYVGTNGPFTASRFPSYSDTHAQSFGSVPFSSNLSSVNSSYWTDSRTHPLHDHYNPYGYNKFQSAYDTYNKSSFLRNSGYHDNLNRSAFDTSRGYYRTSHENLQAGNALTVGTYGGNFMDIAPSASQYCRQDGSVLYQDDLYPGSIGSSIASFGKSYLAAASFR